MRSVEHYLEAEEQLLHAEKAGAESLETRHLLAAQVHATLALAGATALQAYSRGSEAELEDWADAAGDGGTG